MTNEKLFGCDRKVLFAVSGKKDGFKEKVHEKVEEAFNA